LLKTIDPEKENFTVVTNKICDLFVSWLRETCKMDISPDYNEVGAFFANMRATPCNHVRVIRPENQDNPDVMPPLGDFLKALFCTDCKHMVSAHTPCNQYMCCNPSTLIECYHVCDHCGHGKYDHKCNQVVPDEDLRMCVTCKCDLVSHNIKCDKFNNSVGLTCKTCFKGIDAHYESSAMRKVHRHEKYKITSQHFSCVCCVQSLVKVSDSCTKMCELLSCMLSEVIYDNYDEIIAHSKRCNTYMRIKRASPKTAKLILNLTMNNAKKILDENANTILE
jgi:hypothetical protein